MTEHFKKQSLFCLRHGQLEQQHVLAGHTDFLLSKYGHKQLNYAVTTLPDIARIYSSSLSRCSLFAEQLSLQNNIPLTVTDSLKEMNFGDWDGKNFDTLWEKSSASSGVSIGDFWQNPWLNSPPNGETMVQFTARIDCWWHNFLQQPQQGNSLLISHAGVIKHLLARVTKLNINQSELLNVFNVGYAGIVRIDITYDEQQSWPTIVF